MGIPAYFTMSHVSDAFLFQDVSTTTIVLVLCRGVILYHEIVDSCRRLEYGWRGMVRVTVGRDKLEQAGDQLEINDLLINRRKGNMQTTHPATQLNKLEQSWTYGQNSMMAWKKGSTSFDNSKSDGGDQQSCEDHRSFESNKI